MATKNPVFTPAEQRHSDMLDTIIGAYRECADVLKAGGNSAAHRRAIASTLDKLQAVAAAQRLLHAFARTDGGETPERVLARWLHDIDEGSQVAPPQPKAQ